MQFQTQDNTRIYNASLFGAYGLPSGLSLSASVGYSILDSDNQDTEGTVSANVTASYRFNRAFFSVGVFQDFRQTSQQGQNFGTVQTRSYFGSFLYQWTPFINTTLNVSYNENEPTGTGNDRNSEPEPELADLRRECELADPEMARREPAVHLHEADRHQHLRQQPGAVRWWRLFRESWNAESLRHLLAKLSPRHPRSSFKLSRSRWTSHTQRLHRANAM